MDMYLIRHTTPAIEDGICYGHTDVPLADSFEVELTAVVARLPDSFHRVYTSPLSRCARLAERLVATRCISDARLMELDFGAWEGRPWDDIDRAELDAWAADIAGYACPGGESYSQLYRRVSRFCAELERELDRPDQGQCPCAIVAHGGSLRAMLARWMNWSPEQSLRYPIQYGAVSALTLDAGQAVMLEPAGRL
ncbi:MAG: alpha-ribazole phosphatase [Proteobacteria bacterium]|nr:alpha-ribazole phosphatase [Pseudomonadota bacterium]